MQGFKKRIIITLLIVCVAALAIFAMKVVVAYENYTRIRDLNLCAPRGLPEPGFFDSPPVYYDQVLPKILMGCTRDDVAGLLTKPDKHEFRADRQYEYEYFRYRFTAILGQNKDVCIYITYKDGRVVSVGVDNS